MCYYYHGSNIMAVVLSFDEGKKRRFSGRSKQWTFHATGG